MAVPRNPVRYATSGDPFVPTLAKPPAWHAQAACADTWWREAFFQAERALASQRPDPADMQWAIDVCTTCPVLAECDAEWRADPNEQYRATDRPRMIRAGLTPAQRVAIQKEEVA